MSARERWRDRAEPGAQLPGEKRVGILGGGQLARMLVLAARPMRIDAFVVSDEPDAPATRVARHHVADYGDATAASLLATCDVVTYEFENVPADAVDAIAQRASVQPRAAALRVAQDRLHEKTLFEKLGIPTPPFAPIDDQESLERAVARVGLPSILKTRRLGYDGKGQRVLRRPEDVAGAYAALGSVPAILEGFIAFGREMSIVAVRSTTGEERFYPLVENHHEAGILRRTTAPAPDVTPEIAARAESYARAILRELDYVGVLALELFDRCGELLANEIAPRVHNSGHFTIEGAETSQFENHLRAILGMPLGDTRIVRPCVMINCIGTMPDRERVLEITGAHLHDYCKLPAPGRKLGHVTIRGEDAQEVAKLASCVEGLSPR